MTKLNIHKQTSINEHTISSIIDVCLCRPPMFSFVISCHCIVLFSSLIDVCVYLVLSFLLIVLCFFFVICVKGADVTFIY